MNYEQYLGGLPLHIALAASSVFVAAISAAFLLIRWLAVGKSDAALLQGGEKKGSAAKLEQIEDPNKPRIRILYGTQTGTAERFSKQIQKSLKAKYGNSTTIDVVDIENYQASISLPKEKTVIMCMATYGDGEPTDNAAEFYKWLLKESELADSSSEEPLLGGVNYAVFGLGNKQYEHFNSVGKKVFKSMGTLGAKPLVRRGDGDDDGCLDDDFDKWCVELYAALEARSDLVGKVTDQKQDESPTSIPAYDCEIVLSGIKQAPPFPANGTGLDAHHPYMATLKCVKELHAPSSDRGCVHAEIDISSSKMKYVTGDHVAIYAQNSDSVVKEVSQLLGQSNLDSTVILLRKPSATSPHAAASAGLAPPPFTGPLSLRLALAHFADVLSSPHKENLRALAAFAQDPVEAQKLRKMSSPDGKEEFASYITQPKRSLVEVMRDHPSTRQLPLGVFFASVAGRLQPRFYSISSSPLAHPGTVHVTCSLVKDVMPTGRVHEGVASTWLKRCEPPTHVPVFIRQSTFRLPKDTKVPIIMVGPGTGLAPFRGFMQERDVLKKSGKELGQAIMFYGCRNQATDYLYREELEGFLEEGVISELNVAFSRDGPRKDYVQHHMESKGALLWELLSKQAAVLYVCGDAKAMARDVNKALIAVIQSMKGCSGTQAEAFVKDLQDSGRYQRDVW
ncbi:hypothetical protein CEUSTIGMA_g12482.t1 [Chlamydomonas eustigma]|uniref:NADPH--hemoprotein reductase n=1 Tax=Chlamydomonas eustigma TaxID=1157962 RepID=A0A250XQ59_9CHLO|nr:hypothetical protein CEUSTIGMA_g12482.t1 [Chlamydomonas eustigma]|eukprot:GAX85062.1 hypothetical protein CEUSTIGMA_g12482.t1 [Chlamydomonas eustigma]